jgi:hypothetical protein
MWIRLKLMAPFHRPRLPRPRGFLSGASPSALDLDFLGMTALRLHDRRFVWNCLADVTRPEDGEAHDPRGFRDFPLHRHAVKTRRLPLDISQARADLSDLVRQGQSDLILGQRWGRIRRPLTA